MRRVRAVAWREFRHTVLTKGFIFGAIVLPAVMILAAPLIPLLMNSETPPIEGRVVVMDRIGGHLEALRIAVQPPAKDGSTPNDPLNAPVGRRPRIQFEASIEGAPADADEAILRGQVGKQELAALLVITRQDDQVRAELLVPSSASPRHTSFLETATEEALVRARVAATGQDYAQLRGLMRDGKVATARVSPEGIASPEQTELRMLVPLGFMMLLWIAIFTSANYLLTTTIEEKSSRVIEVLLSAVSPMELLLGKLLGQAGVSLVMLLMYGVAGLGGLSALAMLDTVPLSHVLWFLLWFPIAYFMVAAIMAGVGSAVSDLREAQSLVGPAMLALMVPLILWMPIVEYPNGALAVAFSFIPPASPFVMVLRLTAANEPIPVWQSILALVVASGSVAALVWAGARIFRVGVLMQGKTPTPRELLRWIRTR
jgi:ABC-type Na+ efflux pump permease subunit